MDTTSFNKWFDVLKKAGHYIIGYVIMPNHVHAIIAFHNTGKTLNSTVANGKRFMTYAVVNELKKQQHHAILEQLQGWVNSTQKADNKQHEVFEPSFDCKPAWRQTGNAVQKSLLFRN